MLGTVLTGQTISSLTLIDPTTDQAVGSIQEGDTIYTDTYPTINIRADVSASVGSVRFFLNGNINQTENVAPFAMWGDTNGDYNEHSPGVGSYEIKAIAYSGGNASGNSSPEFIRNIVVANRPSQPIDPPANPGTGAVSLSGELRKWHKVTLSFDGPSYQESDVSPNPFLDYRMEVTFTQGNQSFVVPGYFAADGNSAESSASSGNVWRVHFRPNTTGQWDYTVSFKLGEEAAVNPQSGVGLAPLDGQSGNFTINNTNKSGVDFRTKGQLQYVGKRYLQFAETGEYFLKAGADSPENFLAYTDFDNTPIQGNKGNIHTFGPHLGHWNNGDPTWQGGKGKSIIGAVNYLSNQGLNALSMLLYSRNGDDDRIYPYTTRNTFEHFDCSKLDQWEIVLDHAEHKGLYLHFKLSETENDQDHNGGGLGSDRKLYYREMIARFGHHLALNWNISEEITMSENEIRDALNYFQNNDPYQHLRVFHTYPGQKQSRYTPFLGGNELNGASLQINPNSEGPFYEVIKEWVDQSNDASSPWVVACDEQGPASTGVPADNGPNDLHDFERKNLLWAGFLVGGAGLEVYTGGSDQSLEDYASRENFWELCDIALRFFKDEGIPFWNMTSADQLVSEGFCMAGKTDGDQPVYLLYLPDGLDANSDLALFINSSVQANYTIEWFNPRTGGSLQNGSIIATSDTGQVVLGTPPNQSNQDWVIVVRSNDSTNGDPVLGGGSAPNDGIDPSCVYVMEDGLLVIEMESAKRTDDWVVENTRSGAKGNGYILWTGNQYFNQTGNGEMTYRIYIPESGTYRFNWRVGIFAGNDGTEHNDTWLKINADDFYGQKSNGSTVHPKPSCNQTNDCPNGSTKDGFFKIYGGSLNNWAWAARTSDHDAHDIYARFDASGIYTFTINARSSYHGIDRMVMWKVNDVSQSAAQNINNPASPIDCSGLVNVQALPELDAKVFGRHASLFMELPKALPTHYEVIDLQGRLILQGDFITGYHEVPVPVTKGIYVVRLQNAKGVLTRKVVLGE